MNNRCMHKKCTVFKMCSGLSLISVFRASAIGAAKAGNSSAIEALAVDGGDLNIVDK